MPGGNQEKTFVPRSQVLTDADLVVLAGLMKSHAACNMGLTTDEVTTLKRFLAAFDNAASIIGKLVLTALVLALIGIVTKGFWVSLATGIKQVK